MTETALPITNFAENAVMTASRVSTVSWCFARNIYRKGEQEKMIENEMTVSVPLEVVKFGLYGAFIRLNNEHTAVNASDRLVYGKNHILAK